MSIKKFKVPVYIVTEASKHIGTVECDNLEEYEEKAYALWEETDYDCPTTNCHNDFELGEWDTGDMDEVVLNHHKKEETK